MKARRILAADDSTLVLDALDSLFSPLEYRVVAAPNGVVALKLARMLRPDLIIADVMMRGLDGIELLREVRRDPQIGETPIILWSSVYRPHQIRAFADQDQRFIALDKRIDLEELVTSVDRQLSRSSSERGAPSDEGLRMAIASSSPSVVSKS